MTKEHETDIAAEKFLQTLHIPSASDGFAARIALAAKVSQHPMQKGEPSLVMMFMVRRTLLACIISLFVGALVGWKGFDYTAPSHPATAYPQQVASSDIWYDKGDMW